MQNPFTLIFGKSPLEPVERPVQTNEIIDAFTADPINQQMFVITGVRGSGKTVLMTEISQRLHENTEWIVVELNPATRQSSLVMLLFHCSRYRVFSLGLSKRKWKRKWRKPRRISRRYPDYRLHIQGGL